MVCAFVAMPIPGWTLGAPPICITVASEAARCDFESVNSYLPRRHDSNATLGLVAPLATDDQL